jgi:hypothetical protein
MRFEISLSKEFMRPPFQPIVGCSGAHLSSKFILEAEIGRIVIPGQPGQEEKKKGETLSPK